MIWQDVLLSICGFGFSIALLPNLLNKKTQMPLFSSVITGSLLSAMVVAFISLELWLTVISTTLTATMWWLLAIFRRVKK